MKKGILQWLSHPATRGLDIDDPGTTALRHDIIQSKPFLKRLYKEWYGILQKHFQSGGKILELGSGTGFLKECMPNVITSDIMPLPGVEMVVDARRLPFDNGSLDGIVMINVLHHIPDVQMFLSEAERTLRKHGKIVMIEPWRNPWSSLVYRHVHHEPFDTSQSDWKLAGAGPLTVANDALPWIVFQRDASVFKELFPGLKVTSVRPMMPISYLLSGGISMRISSPGWSYCPLRWLERQVGESRTGMFAEIRIDKAPP